MRSKVSKEIVPMKLSSNLKQFFPDFENSCLKESEKWDELGELAQLPPSDHVRLRDESSWAEPEVQHPVCPTHQPVQREDLPLPLLLDHDGGAYNYY